MGLCWSSANEDNVEEFLPEVLDTSEPMHAFDPLDAPAPASLSYMS